MLEEDQHTAILGPNGAGKSTILKLLAGEVHAVPNDNTSIRLFGEAQWNVWEVRKRLGMISHDLQHQYMEYVTGLKVVLSGYYASIGTYGYQDFTYAQIARARTVMDDLGIGEMTDRSYAAMSTGEQRRCLLARALVHDPSVLVLDEPTSGLDPIVARVIDDLIVSVRDRTGVTSVVVSHHVESVLRASDRVALLHEGRILESGTPAEMQASQDPVVRQFLEGRADGPIQIAG